MPGKNEIRINGVPQEIKSKLQNICQNTGTTMSSLLKPKIREIIDAYPEQMKVRREF